MKTSNSNPKNNKTSKLVCLILLAISSPIFSQNKLVSLEGSPKSVKSNFKCDDNQLTFMK